MTVTAAPRPAPALVPPGLVDDFERDGFVLVPDLVDPEELDRFGPLVSAAVRQRKAGDRRSLAEKTRYEQSFLQCINVWEDNPEVLPLTFHPRVAQAAAELLRADAVRLWHDQSLFKEPGGRPTDAHQDQPYWPIAEPRTVTAWIPLDGATPVNGCLGYVPGSHKAGLRRYVDIFRGEPEDIVADPALDGRQPVFVEVPRGSVAFHHGLTVHLAKPNRSAFVRRVHTVIYFADGCTRSTDRAHGSVDRAGIAVGGAIASDVTPIVWPRPDGDLPVPPAPASTASTTTAPTASASNTTAPTDTASTTTTDSTAPTEA